MNDLQKMARIMLGGLGVYLLVNSVSILLGMFPLLMMVSLEKNSDIVYWGIVFGVIFILSLVAAYYLLSRSDILARKMARSEEHQEAQIWWVPCAFRLSCILAGLLCLYWSVFRLTSEIYRLVNVFRYDMPARYWTWHGLVAWPIQFALGVYLICGAPHFVRWQVKKTLEHCKRWEEPDSISDQEAGV